MWHVGVVNGGGLCGGWRGGAAPLARRLCMRHGMGWCRGWGRVVWQVAVRLDHHQPAERRRPLNRSAPMGVHGETMGSALAWCETHTHALA
jgi:hypothetical protein